MLDSIIAQLKNLIRELMTELAGSNRSQIVIGGWVEAMARLLTRYSAAAYMAGQDSPNLTPKAKQKIAKAVDEQLGYLENFAIEIQEGQAWEDGWEARAESYANSVGKPYWQGKTKMLPLPAMPGDMSTSCGVRCRCEWDIKKLAGDGNWDCIWKLREKAGHCQGCEQRADDWQPLKIRGGRIEV